MRHIKLYSLGLVFILMIAMLTGCASTSSDFKIAKQTNTIEGYGKFLTKHSKSKFSEEAKELRENLMFLKAKQINSISSYERYLKEYPNGVFVSKVNKYIEKLNFGNAMKENTIVGYENYLIKYPNGIYASKADHLREEMRFDIVKKENTISGYDKYLREYPNGILRENINSIFVRKAKEIRGKLVFEKASSNNSLQAYEEYLEKHPNGKYASEAKSEIKRLINSSIKSFKFSKSKEPQLFYGGLELEFNALSPTTKARSIKHISNRIPPPNGFIYLIVNIKFAPEMEIIAYVNDTTLLDGEGNRHNAYTYNPIVEDQGMVYYWFKSGAYPKNIMQPGDTAEFRFMFLIKEHLVKNSSVTFLGQTIDI